MTIIGGDLAAMASLAQRFRVTGESFLANASAIVRRTDGALGEFRDTVTLLERDAQALNGDIGEILRGLRRQAESTVWTGANRARQDELLALMEQDIVGVQTAISAFTAEALDVVNGSLTPAIATMQQDITRAGDRALHIAGAFAHGVAAQRDAFDLVMNG